MFKDRLIENGSYPLKGDNIEVLQVNLGYRCNMACKHCHVEAGPSRREMMNEQTVEAIIGILSTSPIKTIDITGGAPELNPHFKTLIRKSREIGKHVIVRSNLTIFFEDGMGSLPGFLREHCVEVIASLPYYLEDYVDRIRGAGAFSKSMSALSTLNGLGYGRGSELNLNLVYNPQGAFLPTSQSTIEDEYKRKLKENFDIEFNHLYTFTNMPIGRFREFLERSGNLGKYMTLLSNAFNPATLGGIMCRHLISVGWDGTLYDCDFNQIVGLKVSERVMQSVFDFDFDTLSQREIAVGDHCFGCTAGQGST